MVDWKSVSSTATLEKIGVVESSFSPEALERAQGQVVSFGGTVTGAHLANARAPLTSLILTLRDEASTENSFRAALNEPNYFASSQKWQGVVATDLESERNMLARFDRAASTLVVKDERFRIDLLQEPGAVIRSAEVRVSAPGIDLNAPVDSPVSVIHYTLDYDATDTDAVIHRWRFLFREGNYPGASGGLRLSVWAPRQERQTSGQAFSGETALETQARVAIDSFIGMGLSFGCLAGAAQLQSA